MKLAKEKRNARYLLSVYQVKCLLFKSNVTLFVNKLDSDQSVVPFEYHTFDFCIGSEDESPVENLGQVLFGERIRPSPYNINFNEQKQCSVLCEKNYDLDNTESQEKMKLLKRGMKLNYQHHW